MFTETAPTHPKETLHLTATTYSQAAIVDHYFDIHDFLVILFKAPESAPKLDLMSAADHLHLKCCRTPNSEINIVVKSKQNITSL